MGDFFDFEQGNKNTVNNILYGDRTASGVNVVVAEYFEGKQLAFLVQFFKMCGVEPLVVYPFSRPVTEHDFRKGVEKFFIDNVIENLKDFLNPQNAVVTVGRGLYAATRDVSLQVDAFYYSDDLQPSYFYCPFLRNYVYPIDAVQKIIKTDYKGAFVQLFDRYVTEFAKQQIRKAAQNHGAHLKKIEPVKIVEVKDATAQLREWTVSYDGGEENRYVSLDIETGGFNRLSDEIGCLTVSFDGKTAYFLKWKHIDTDWLYLFLKTRYVITSNGKFDVLFLMFHGVEELKISWDTMIAGHFLNEMMSAGLKAHSWIYTDYGGYDIELEKYKRKFPGCRYIDVPTPVLKKYAGMDAICSWLIWKQQREIMGRHPEMLACYEKYAIGMLDVFKEMEFRGFPVDWEMVGEQSAFLKRRIAEAEKAVFDAFGIEKTDANANLLTSKKQLGLFLEEKGWECINRVKLKIGAYYNVSKYELHEWKKKGHKEASLIMEYNKWTAIYNTFVGAEDHEAGEFVFGGDALLPDLDYANRDNATGLWQYRQVDDKVHGTYKTMMTRSHRNASADPNLQNLSKRNWETALIVRKCYTAPLEEETDKENASFVKVYDAEHGLRLFKPGDKFKVNWNWNNGVFGFEDAGELPGVIARYYRTVPKGEYHIFEADAAGLQARIAASMSGDPKLRELFLNDGDFHSTNAYNMMARYQKFEEIRCSFQEGEKTFMEWEPLKITRNGKEVEHAAAKDLLEGDSVEPYGVPVKIGREARHLKDYEEFAKNCKHGKLKELRQTAKMCFAKGTKIKVTGESVPASEMKKGDILLMDGGTGANVSMFQWSGSCQKFFDTAESWESAVLRAEEIQKVSQCGIYELVLTGDSEYRMYDMRNRYVNIENLAGGGVFGVGVPYTGTRLVFDHHGMAREILGTIQTRPEEKIEFELANGETFTVTPDHEMPIIRNGVKTAVPAEQVLETDELAEV